MNDAEKLAAIRARIERMEHEDANRWTADRTYTLEDIQKILDDEEPDN